MCRRIKRTMRMTDVRAGRTAGRALVDLEGPKAGAAVRVIMLREAICKSSEKMIEVLAWCCECCLNCRVSNDPSVSLILALSR